MAFSQVEVASCVLKDQNRRERCNTMASAATQAAFQKNLKELVRDHLCISVSSVNPEQEAGDNSQNHQKLTTTTTTTTTTTCITNFQEGDDNKDPNGKQQARILDRWAAKQAEEMVSTIEESSSLSTSEDQKPTKSGASSLVQMWEARLHPAHIKVDRCNSYKNSPKSAGAGPSNLCGERGNNDIIHVSEQKTDGPGSRLGSRSSSSKTSPSSVAANDDLADPNNENIAAASTSRNEEIVTRHNEMTASSSSSARTSGVNEELLAQFGRSSTEAAESERVRITDIIKKLKCENGGNENDPGGSICEPSPRRISDAGDPKSFSLVVNVNSLKIRGRQAYQDLLVQMEQERKKEINSVVDRHSVSKFPHRGRIQSMLRVRSLERGMAIQNRQREQYQSVQCTTPSHANRSHRLSLRERFSKGIADDASGSLTPKSGKEIEINSIVSNENRTTLLRQVIKSNHCGDISVTNHQVEAEAEAPTTSKSCKEKMEKCIIVDNKNGSTLDHVLKIDHNPCIFASSKSGKEIDNCTVNNKHGSTMIMKSNNCRDFCTSDSLSQTSEVHDDVHEESSARSDVTWQGTSSEINNFGAGEAFESMDNWEVNDEIDVEQDFHTTNYDWFSDIARPRSYWEDLRKGWYEEMLTCSSEDNEIKQLLQRKTVSSFLTSDFRARMDQMIMSHVQIQVSQEDEELQEEGQERMGQLIMSFLQRQSHPSGGDEEQRDNADADADDEQDNDDEECVDNDQDPNQDEQVIEGSENPQSTLSSWYQEVSRDSEQVSRPSVQSEASPSTNPIQPSIEMDLRRQMEQLQQEMYELRKTMQACLEMQAHMRSSVKEVVVVQPQPEAARTSNDMTRMERKCCICYDKKVDTFLYRCGHMCTCLKCAHELQWSSGKCPICRVPILDVVRAYMDS
ncbi:RING/U-box superfamily protein [Euphorbia peplus]|nr:RING/U-box superfamily protein [Euphorbia peplus]